MIWFLMRSCAVETSGLATSATSAMTSRMPPCFSQKALADSAILHHVDQAADEGEQAHLDERAEEARHQQHREGGPHRLDEVDVERKQRVRRPGRRLVRKRLDAGLEPAEHGSRPRIRVPPDFVSRDWRACGPCGGASARPKADGSGGNSNHRDARAAGRWTGGWCAERRGDRQRSKVAMISIMAAAPGYVVASSGAPHSTPQSAAPARALRSSVRIRTLEAHA